VLQALPTPHAAQFAPQSMSVSAPFSTPSVHEGVWQIPETHTPLSQSVAARQPARSVHFVAQEPPQSTSLSPPLRTWSVHDGD
jgi:hypothetical protein